MATHRSLELPVSQVLKPCKFVCKYLTVNSYQFYAGSDSMSAPAHDMDFVLCTWGDLAEI